MMRIPEIGDDAQAREYICRWQMHDCRWYLIVARDNIYAMACIAIVIMMLLIAKLIIGINIIDVKKKF